METLAAPTAYPIVWFQAAALVLARLVPIISLTPLFGGQATPRRFRFGVAILLALILLPMVLAHPSTRPLDATALTGLLLKEALIGLTISLLILVIFETFSAFGYLVDTARGATFANVLDPLSHQHQSVLSVFFVQLSIVIFLASGGYRLFIGSIATSLDKFPPFLPAPDSLVGRSASGELIGVVSSLFETAFRLAAPVLVVMLLLDVALGIVNRVAPQFQAFFVGMTLKGSLGLILVFAGLALTFDTVLPEFVSQTTEVISRFGR